MFKTLILMDNDAVSYSLDLIEAAKRLAGEEQPMVYGLGINLKDKNIKGLDVLICIDDSTLQMKDSRVWTDLAEQVQNSYQFDSILILATEFGRMVAPRLAMRLKTGLVADITDIEVDEQGRKLIRPAFSGNMLASIICESSPIMASVHPNVFHAGVLTKKTKRIDFSPEKLKASTIDVLSVSNGSKQEDIREAKVIVAAGAGYSADISQLQELADELTGVVAVSKKLVDAQRAPREIQVGQSGKTVSPELYIALGIYGSMQHIEGLKDVKDIISVNIDKGAPMNYLAELAVIGDAAEFVEKLKLKLAEK